MYLSDEEITIATGHLGISYVDHILEEREKREGERAGGPEQKIATHPIDIEVQVRGRVQLSGEVVYTLGSGNQRPGLMLEGEGG